MYTFDGRVRYSEVGEDGCMSLESLLNYFQDCSTFHSEDIGLGRFGFCPPGRFVLKDIRD